MGVAVSSAFSCFSRGYFPLTAGISVPCIDFRLSPYDSKTVMEGQ